MEIPAKTPRPIGRTDNFFPGRVKAAEVDGEASAAAEPEAAATGVLVAGTAETTGVLVLPMTTGVPVGKFTDDSGEDSGEGGKGDDEGCEDMESVPTTNADDELATAGEDSGEGDGKSCEDMESVPAIADDELAETAVATDEAGET
jgi:hypothetical protein